MIKTLQIIIIFLVLGHSSFCAISLPDACTSVGDDSSFEFIDRIVVGHLTNSSGNNAGYLDYKDQYIDIDLGSFQDIELVPGYESNNYKEGWNIWIDYNKDGYFDNETENVLSKSEIGVITSTIRISNDPNHVGIIRMRISMQYLSGAEPCENVTYGEVEDYYLNIQNSDQTDPCRSLSFDDFEDGYSTWEDGGSDCSLINRGIEQEQWSIRLRDNSSTSILTSKSLDLSIYNELKIAFDFEANSMEADEDFWLQISNDDGESYTTIKTWSSGIEFINGKEYNEEIILNDLGLTSSVKIRWKCDATANADQIYLDNIHLSACYHPSHTKVEELLLTNNASLIDGESINSNSLFRPEKTDLSFDVYPNPSSDILSFSIEEPRRISAEYFHVTLTNMNGQVIKSININNNQLEYNMDISQYDKGMYLLNLYDNNQIVESTKVMIIR